MDAPKASEADGLCASVFSGPSNRKEALVTVPAAAYDYRMNSESRGICLILNYMLFSIPGLDPRPGSDRDRDALKRTFTNLGFTVKVPPDNLTKLKTLEEIKAAAKKDHTDSDCFALCFLSHGDAERVLYASDEQLGYDDIFEMFTPDKCPSLAGKPKLFFFQACQGKATDPGVRLKARADGSTFPSYRIPLQADFLAAYSTVPGYVSYRSSDGSGSWFMKSLVHELSENWEHLDLASIMTLVCRKVAMEYETDSMRDKQATFWTSTLTRFVRFSQNNNNFNNNNNTQSSNNRNGHAIGAGGTLIDTLGSGSLGGSADEGTNVSGVDGDNSSEVLNESLANSASVDDGVKDLELANEREMPNVSPE